MPSLPWIFICPSSRGIGYALTRHLLLSTTLPILATTRQDPSATKAALLSDLQKHQPKAQSRLSNDELSRRLHLARCDVKDESTIRDAADLAGELFPAKTHHLHLACAMPGILTPEKSVAQIDAESSLEMFRVNALGPMLLMKHFVGFLPRRATDLGSASPSLSSSTPSSSTSITLPRHATWLTMAARVGSTTDNRTGGWFSYRASKAAAISNTRSLDISLAARSGDNALAVAYHPGTVATDFSREFWAGVPEGKLFSSGYAAERLASVVCGIRIGERGRCWDWKGEEVLP